MTGRLMPALIVLLAILLRVGLILQMNAIAAPAEENRVIARNLATGNGFTFSDFNYTGPTTVRPPLYPAVLAGLDRLFGAESRAALAAALTLNVVAGVGAVLLAMTIARDFCGRRVAIVTAFFFAIWPTQIYAAAQFQGLVIAVVLMLAAMWFAMRQWPVMAGLMAALAILCESILLFPLVPAVLWSFRRQRGGMLLAALTVLALLLPWAYRDSLVRGHLSLLSGRFAADLFYGNGEGATGSRHLDVEAGDVRPRTMIDHLSPQQYDALRNQPETARDALFYTWASSWIRQHPFGYVQLCFERAVKTLWLDWDHPMARSNAYIVSQTLEFAVAIFAMWRLRWRQEEISFSAILMVGLALAATFTLAEARNGVLMDVPQLLLGVTLLRRGGV